MGAWIKLLSTGLVLASLLAGQTPKAKPDPVKWSLRLEPDAAAPGQKILGRLTATIEPGWHFYSLTTPKPTIPTTVALAASPVVAKWVVWAPAPKRAYDPYFKQETESYEKAAEILVEIETASGAT